MGMTRVGETLPYQAGNLYPVHLGGEVYRFEH